MNPKLTCSQRQWLHSSVGRASHRYREVTGSSPVEVLNFFFRLLYAIVKIAIITSFEHIKCVSRRSTKKLYAYGAVTPLEVIETFTADLT